MLAFAIARSSDLVSLISSQILVNGVSLIRSKSISGDSHSDDCSPYTYNI